MIATPRYGNLTDLGLPGICDLPYGAHLCHFYEDRAALAAALVPYFAAGLRLNERCLWVTAAPLPAAEALDELRKAGLDVDAALERGALVVRDHADWYAAAGRLKGRELVSAWLDEETRALAEGYRGLRITGNVSFLQPADWALFMDYEALVNRSFHGRRIVALCSYELDRWGAPEANDVVRRHNCTLVRPARGWQLLPAPRRL